MEMNHDAGLKALSPALRPILELELALGNAIHSVDIGAWTDSPLVVTMRNPLHPDEIRAKLALPSEQVTFWENTDTHYPLERGFACKETRHSISGPMEKP